MRYMHLMIGAVVAAILLCTSCKDEPVHRPTVPDPSEQKDPAEEIKGTQLVTKNGTLLRTSCADPSLVYWKGEFYLTMTGASNLALVHDSDLSALTTSAHSTS